MRLHLDILASSYLVVHPAHRVRSWLLLSLWCSNYSDYDINTRVKPHLNVGTIGHVDHGKTTLTAAITKARTCMRPARWGKAPLAGPAGRPGSMLAGCLLAD